MSDQLYIRIRGVTKGPYTEEQLRGLVRRGVLARIHEISSDGKFWEKAEDFPHLFGAVTPALVTEALVTEAPREEAPSPIVAPVTAPVAATVAVEPQYFYLEQGVRQGPVERSLLQGLLNSRRLAPDELICEVGNSQWTPASSCPQLQVSFPPYAPHYGAPFEGSRTSRLAIASLILGMLWGCGVGSLLAVIFGWDALLRISKSQGRLTGTGLALAGLCLGVLGGLIAVLGGIVILYELGTP